MTEPAADLKALSAEELKFLLQASETNLLAFLPQEDPMIMSLIERRLIDVSPDSDPTHCILRITGKGRAVVQIVLDESEFPST